MNQTILTSLLTTIFSLAMAQTHKEDLEEKRLPPQSINANLSKEVKKFIPVDYEILDREDGDINNDGLRDKILILKSKVENNSLSSETERPLLLLIRGKDGKLREVKRNNNVVMTQDSGGIYGDPYHGITIKNDFFSIEHFGGSGWRWNYVITFRYDKGSNDWFLYQIGNEVWHIGNPDNPFEFFESHRKTSKEFGIIRFSDYTNDLLNKSGD